MMSPDQPVDVNLQTEAGLGARLRLAREKLGLTTKDVAAQIHLGPRHIEAIEREDFNYIAAPVFVRGYLRNYARLLNLPSDRIVQQYEALAGVSPPPLKGFPIGDATPAGEADKTVRWIIYAIVLGSAILAVVWWMTEGTFKFKEDDVVASLAAQASLQEPHPLETRVTATQPPTPPPAVVAETGPSTKPSTSAAPVDSVSLVAAAAATSPPNSTTVQQTPAQQAAPVAAADSAAPKTRALSLSFSADSWVEITDGKGKRLFYDLAKHGSQQSFQDVVPPIQILLGNAPAVTVDYNGKRFDHSRYNRNNVARFSLE
ncbi:MAG TPA: RodZ domain-containing protein [Gammaproteobacteria bacterium]|nr:RodZ domain-containing protein [Gammaproteobacteria bacterium]